MAYDRQLSNSEQQHGWKPNGQISIHRAAELMSRDITFSSALPEQRREELAELMFFNTQQHRVRNDIVHAIERYGMPEIVTTDGSLRFSVGELGLVQSLFALEGTPQTGRLLGVMLYARVTTERLVLLHIGVDPSHASGGEAAERLLAMQLIGQLRTAAKLIVGIDEIEILYGRGSKRIKIR